MDAKFIEDLVAEVRDDYAARSAQRQRFESQWQLNANFVAGNQYCRIGALGGLEESDRDYYWQEREVFNHIATILESRLAKLSRVRPAMSVVPVSGDDADVRTAKVSGKILKATCTKLRMSEIISQATMWSELTGSVFYKVVWDGSGGRRVGKDKSGKPLCEGDVRVDVCPPYEILPDSLTCQSIDDCRSVIHAKAVPVADVKRVWGADVEPEETDVISPESMYAAGGPGPMSAGQLDRKRDRVTVIERYTRPTDEHPDGELVIVAGKKLLHYGPLPFVNGADGSRELPFVRQTSLERAGCFYGTSMVERAIPIQRAYNAVKNRKHEFLSRIAMGVLCVEDGSVDTDNLETEGLSPGKILVYRQGSPQPHLLSPGTVPADFTVEEQRLLDEFVDVSGISEMMRSSSVPSTITSGAAIRLLVEQDDTRISVTAENIRAAVKRLAEFILRLYRAYADGPRLSRCVGEEGETELISWTRSDIGGTDVAFETENEVSSSAAARQSTMLDLLRAGLLYDESGKLTDDTRYKILEVFGYGGWERTQDVRAMHIARAVKENAALGSQTPEVCEVDDHDVHVSEHVKYFLGSEFASLVKRRPELKETLLGHIREHRRFARVQIEAEAQSPAEGGDIDG